MTPTGTLWTEPPPVLAQPPRALVARFVIPGVPAGKARARRGPAGNWYTPQATQDAEELVVWAFRAGLVPAGRGWLLGAKVSYSVTMRAYFQKAPKRDNDNLEKLVFDALNGVCWKDDAQIMHNQTTKEFHSPFDATWVEIYAW